MTVETQREYTHIFISSEQLSIFSWGFLQPLRIFNALLTGPCVCQSMHYLLCKIWIFVLLNRRVVLTLSYLLNGYTNPLQVFLNFFALIMRFQRAYACNYRCPGCYTTCWPLVSILSLYIIYTYEAIYYWIISFLLFLKSPQFQLSNKPTFVTLGSVLVQEWRTHHHGHSWWCGLEILQEYIFSI